ncbi:MAG: hypothetical protein KGH69_02850 [Candidatus Micrarchaeota archaeon]|nr:hypothetical protein [Candidatus Micrarchaeota archaeon]
MEGKNNRVTVRRESLQRFFFIKPDANGNIRDAACRLLRFKGISEVFVSEGDYGLMVKADCAEGQDRLRSYISRNYRGRFGEVVCHYSYRIHV